jgi:hypothetical protein
VTERRFIGPNTKAPKKGDFLVKSRFRIGVCTAAEILANQPPQFRHTNLIFTPFGIRVGDRDFPAPGWTDFAGASLFKWCRAVWAMSFGEARAARLTFWYTYEFWLRRTASHWWRLSLVERTPDSKRIISEALVLPERVEAELLTASRKLIAGAKAAGVWTEDCAALQAFLDDPEEYLRQLEAGIISPPSFLAMRQGPRL